MIPNAYINHIISGRVRLKIPDKRHDNQYFANCTHIISNFSDVTRIECNPATASILIFGIGNANIDDLGTYCRKQALFTIDSHSESSHTINDRIGVSFDRLDTKLKRISDGEIDVKSIMFLSLVGMTVSQFISGQRLAPATTLLWYALQTLPMWEQSPKTSDSNNNNPLNS
jgi:hypothetical protein